MKHLSLTLEQLILTIGTDLFNQVVSDVVDRQVTIQKEICYISLQQTQQFGINGGLNLHVHHTILRLDGN